MKPVFAVIRVGLPSTDAQQSEISLYSTECCAVWCTENFKDIRETVANYRQLHAWRWFAE